MATTINATTTGLVETSDGTAVLDLQTGGTTAIRVNAAQAIGVGSSPSFGTAGQFLTSQGNAASPTWTSGGSGTVTSVGWTGGIVSIATATTTPAFTIAGTSGGIPYFSSGTAWASSAALTQYGVVYGGGAGAAPVATAAGTTGQFLGANTSGAPTWQTPSGGGSPGGNNTYVQYNSSGAFAGSARMTFNGTKLFIGAADVGGLDISTSLVSYDGISMTDTTSSLNGLYVRFLNSSASICGSIAHNGTTTVQYNTSSDSRLKDDLGVAIETDVIDNIVIRNFRWKQDGNVDRGVFAQEAYQIKPSAVYVGSDELTEDGNLQKPWGVDYSKFVPDLIVYAQQLKRTVQELTARIEALEAK
jgi:hypothetical protein